MARFLLDNSQGRQSVVQNRGDSDPYNALSQPQPPTSFAGNFYTANSQTQSPLTNTLVGNQQQYNLQTQQRYNPQTHSSLPNSHAGSLQQFNPQTQSPLPNSSISNQQQYSQQLQSLPPNSFGVNQQQCHPQTQFPPPPNSFGVNQQQYHPQTQFPPPPNSFGSDQQQYQPQTQFPAPNPLAGNQQQYNGQAQSSTSFASTLRMKTYHVTYTFSRLNLELHLNSASGPVEYYMESAFLNMSKPQLFLRFGKSKSAPMVAFGKIAMTGRKNQIGLGDFKRDDERNLVWEELSRDRNVFLRSGYGFSAASTAGGARIEYSWEKDMSKIVSSSFTCFAQDKSGGQGRTAVAKMSSGGAFNWKNAGVVEIAEGLDKGLEALLIVGALTVWSVEGLMGWSLAKADTGTK